MLGNNGIIKKLRIMIMKYNGHIRNNLLTINLLTEIVEAAFCSINKRDVIKNPLSTKNKSTLRLPIISKKGILAIFICSM
jgi:hypothetical protein